MEDELMDSKKTYSAFFIAGIILAKALTSATWTHAAEDPCANEETYPLINKADLQKAAESKSAFIVDVNSDSSYKKAHVPGAIHYGSHKNDFAKLLPADKNKLIVSYCGGPQCSAWKKAAEDACKQGYKNIRHFKEGISGWTKS